MKLLLDTHILLWAMTRNPEVSDKVWNMVADPDNDVYYSTASVWEVTIKHMAKPEKMKITGQQLAKHCATLGFRMLPITDDHVRFLETLVRKEGSAPHNDPFDRIMIAQAKAENLLFITHDSLIPDYEEPCVVSV